MWGLNPNACVEMSILACHLPSNAQEQVDTLSQGGWKKAKGLAQQMWVFWLGLSRDDSLKIMQLQPRGPALASNFTHWINS